MTGGDAPRLARSGFEPYGLSAAAVAESSFQAPPASIISQQPPASSTNMNPASASIKGPARARGFQRFVGRLRLTDCVASISARSPMPAILWPHVLTGACPERAHFSKSARPPATMPRGWSMIVRAKGSFGSFFKKLFTFVNKT